MVGGLHHQAADLAFELGKHPVMFLSSGFARLDHDLLRRNNGFLRLLLPQAGGCRTRFLDESIGLDICLRHHFLALRFGPG